MKENIKDNNIDEITIIYQNRGNILIKAFDNWYIKEKLGEEISKNKLFGEKFINNNKKYCKIIINGEEKELCSFYNIQNLRK